MIVKTRCTLRVFLSFFTLAVGVGQVSQEGIPYSFDQNLSGEIPVMRMPAVDAGALIMEDENRPTGTPFRYGATLPVNLSLENSDVWKTLPKGDKIWRMKFESSGAFAISLVFDRFYLPPKSTLFVYSPDRKTVYGAYTSMNNNPDNIFATPLVPGDKIIVEIVIPSGGEKSDLSISELIHDYRDILNFFGNQRDRSCGENVACPDAAPYEDQINATAWLLMGSWMCSGAMINNADFDLTPYFLTAWHCVDGLSPGIFKFYFNYETPGCSGNNASYGSYAYGSTLRASSDANTNPMDPDFALLEITGTIYNSWDVFYSGWNRSYSSPLISCGVHHPGGDPKKINYDNDYAGNSPGINWNNEGYSPPGSHWSVAWDDGGTEGGSSGSPLFDNDGRIVGQLSGGGGECVTGDNTYYGKISRAWDGSGPSSRLKDWLDPDNTGVSNIEGTYDGAPSNPEITVTSPNGGEDWEIGSSHPVTWSSASAGSFVKIELFLSGNFYAIIASSTSNDGYYNWSIPAGNDPSSNYKVKITDTSNSSTYDYSDNYFTLSGSPFITVLSPNGGEDWALGSTQEISWYSDFAGTYVKIELYEGGSFQSTIVSSTSNDESYDWAIPNTLEESDAYKVKITDSGNSSTYDFSNSNFSLSISGWPEFDFSALLNAIDDESMYDMDLIFGTNLNATNGYDHNYDMYAPPAPPPPAFDAALFNSIVSDRFFIDYRPTTPEEETTEWQIHMQAGQGATQFTVSWNPSELGDGQFILQDMFGGLMVNVNMKNQSSVSVETVFNQLKIVHTNSASSILTVDYLSGWNMVGLPLGVDDSSVTTIFPEAINGTLYSYNGSYSQVDFLENGNGYWLRFTSSGSSEIIGTEITSITLSLQEGWNLISGISSTIGIENIIDPSNIIIDGTLYGYNGSYLSSDNLTPGAGYWLRTNADGEITLSSSQQSSKSIPAINHLSDANTLEFSNGTHSNILYFGKDIPEGEELSYSLPPVFPQMVFDARFTDDMKYTKDLGEIIVINTDSRLTLNYSVNIEPGESQEWILTTQSGEEHILNRTGEITLSPKTKGMTLEKRAIVPEVYALHQNYPNPFNPVTIIRFSLVEPHRITSLRVFDITGRMVETLVNKKLEAGYHEIQWDASQFSSGVYFVELVSGEIRQIQKLVLLK